MYPPISMYSLLNIDDIPSDNRAKKYLTDIRDGNTELYRILTRVRSFGTGHYNGPYMDYSNYIHTNWKNLFTWAMGHEPEKDVFNKSNRATVIDSLMGIVMVSKWGKFKRVYRFDPELELSLATVDEVKIPLNMLDNLPYTCFYVEFAPDGVFYPLFHGCFVDIIKYADTVEMNVVRLKDDLRSMSGTFTFGIDHSMPEPYVTVWRDDVDGKHASDPLGLRDDWEEFCLFILNAIIYLCASNAEVRETKNKNISVPKKHTKAAEATTVYECGYVFGKNIRLQREKERELENKIIRNTKTRRSPRPHPVKASWQHYWTGSGENKKRVLMFKAAYFVGGKANYATVSEVTA